MPLIVVMEDDAGTRMLVASVLKKDGYEVLAAENGLLGLQMVRESRPDLIISDIQMPELNGFQMLAAVRKDASLASIPVILLTSLQERAHMRIGMTTGADDYITKPFRPGELREAVTAQLNKRVMQASLHSMAVDAAVNAALQEQKHQLSKLYEQRLAKELSERWPESSDTDGDVRFSHATVLFADIPNYVTVAERLSSVELSELVKKFYGSAGDTVHLFGARHIQFIGEGLLAVFVDSTDTKSVNHGFARRSRGFGSCRVSPWDSPVPADPVSRAVTAPVRGQYCPAQWACDIDAPAGPAPRHGRAMVACGLTQSARPCFCNVRPMPSGGPFPPVCPLCAASPVRSRSTDALWSNCRGARRRWMLPRLWRWPSESPGFHHATVFAAAGVGLQSGRHGSGAEHAHRMVVGAQQHSGHQ
jgi:CheY-like chemotaxis protein